MTKTNVFMNSYQQSENKLTYNFLCLIEHMPFQKLFCEFLTDQILSLSENPLLDLESVFGGYDSNPDGLLRLQGESGVEYEIYLENKTYRLPLTAEQLRNHLSCFCKSENSYLLVITPRITDKSIALSVDSKKIFFKTWNEIADKLIEIKQHDNSFVISQFVKYGKESGEFESMDLSKDELNSYILSIKANVKGKIRHIIENAIENINFKDLGIDLKEKSWKEHWGRSGVELYFKPNLEMGQWFFFGIYYDKSDHGIPFKQDNEPELAFFFDIEPSNRNKLKQDPSFIESLKNVTQLGFEENLTKVITSNQWRLLFKREPLSKSQDKFSGDEMKKYIEKILQDLLSQSYFAKLLKFE